MSKAKKGEIALNRTLAGMERMRISVLPGTLIKFFAGPVSEATKRAWVRAGWVEERGEGGEGYHCLTREGWRVYDPSNLGGDHLKATA